MKKSILFFGIIFIHISVWGQSKLTYSFGRETRVFLDTIIAEPSEAFVLDIPVKLYGGHPLAWINDQAASLKIEKKPVFRQKSPAKWAELLMANMGKKVELEVDEGKNTPMSYTGIVQPIQEDAQLLLLKLESGYEFIDLSRVVQISAPNMLVTATEPDKIFLSIPLPQRSDFPLRIRLSFLITEAFCHPLVVLDSLENNPRLSLQSSIKLAWKPKQIGSFQIDKTLSEGTLSFSSDSIPLLENEQIVVLQDFSPALQPKFQRHLELDALDILESKQGRERSAKASLFFLLPNKAHLAEEFQVIPRSSDWFTQAISSDSLVISKLEPEIRGKDSVKVIEIAKKPILFQKKKWNMIKLEGFVTLTNEKSVAVSLELKRKTTEDTRILALSILDEMESPKLFWINQTVLLAPHSTEKLPYKGILLIPFE